MHVGNGCNTWKTTGREHKVRSAAKLWIGSGAWVSVAPPTDKQKMVRAYEAAPRTGPRHTDSSPIYALVLLDIGALLDPSL